MNKLVEIKTSKIPNSGLGVFANTFIPKESRDQYVGSRHNMRFNPDDSSCTWILYEYDENGHVKLNNNGRRCGNEIGQIDGFNGGNWTRFVNCSNSQKEANVDILQLFDKIYYVTNRDIFEGEELLVWYGQDYYDLI